MSELSLKSLLARDFCSPFFKAKELTASGQSCRVQVSDAGVTLEPSSGAPTLIPWEMIKGWEFLDRLFCLAYRADEETNTVVLKLADHLLEDLRQAFHLVRLKRYASALSPEERAKRRLTPCSACALHLSLPDEDQAPTHFCPECLAIFSEQEILTDGKNEPYNFCQSGLFRMIGKQSRHEWLSFAEKGAYQFRSFRREVAPTLDKLAGHTLWTGLWLILLAAAWYPFHLGWFGTSATAQTTATIALYTLMALVGLHLTLLGFYAAGLVMSKAMRALLFPHPYEKIAQRCAEGRIDEAQTLMKESHLEGHPGMIANLALAQWKKGLHQTARENLIQAACLCPNHPVLLQFNLDMALPEDKDQWREGLSRVLPHNQLTDGQNANSLATPQSCS